LTCPQLETDPENMNHKRAAWAEAALREFQRATGAEDENALGDLLCDLMHLADRRGWNFDAGLERAQMHYEAETLPECDYFEESVP
jgi:hypothetical protein